MQEALQEVLAVEHTVEVSVPAVEPMGEEKEEKKEGEGMEEDRRRGSSSTGNLAPRLVPVLQRAMLLGLGFGC